jgi:hypothetical protein
MPEELKPNEGDNSKTSQGGDSNASTKFWNEFSSRNEDPLRQILGPLEGPVRDGGAGNQQTIQQEKKPEDSRSKAQQELIHKESGVDVPEKPPTLERDEAALHNVKTELFKKVDAAHQKDGEDNKLRAAAVLAANVQTELTNSDGGTYKINRKESGEVTLIYKDTAQSAERTISGIVAQDASLTRRTDKSATEGSAPSKDGPAPNVKPPVAPEKPPAPNEKLPSLNDNKGAKKNSTDDLFDPKLSIEERLKVAREIAHNEHKRFTGPDKHLYEITTKKYGDRESVAIQMRDDHGHTHPILRGIFEKDGTLSKQRDEHHKEVEFSGDWARKQDSDNPLLHHEEPKQEKPTPPPVSEVDSAREKLKKDVHGKVQGQLDQDKFLQQMDTFEQRAKAESLPEKQVIDTYDQLSRLLEANEAKVPLQDRVLAAQTFAYHMANPETVDQGLHNTCNMTSLSKREIFINTAAGAAEVLASTAIAGEYTAPDGQKIKIDGSSLVPGAEEKNHPPLDGDRSYATQLMNLALINDALQRRMPPEYYSQERPTEHGSTGEVVRYADGTEVRRNKPGIYTAEIQAEGTRLEGRTKFMLQHDGFVNQSNLSTFASKEEFLAKLKEIKASPNEKFPPILLVDANDPIFNGYGETNKPSWHVVLIKGFDEATGKVSILNQWGRHEDKTVSIEDLYRSTRTPQ